MDSPEWTTHMGGVIADIPDLHSTGSFALAVRPHQMVMGLVARRLAPWCADDVVQNALLAAWRHRRTYDPSRGQLRPWLVAITVRESHREAGKRWRWERLTARVTNDAWLTESGSSSSNDDTFAELSMAIGRLSSRQRDVVALHYYADLTVADTASALGLSPGTVKSTLSDARQKIRRILENGAIDGR